MNKKHFPKVRTGYYPSGNKQYEIYRVEDSKLLSISWYESGQSLAEIFWKVDSRDFNLDALLSRWASSGHVKLGDYSLNQYKTYIHGNVSYWYESGQLHHESNFINGVSDGAETWYRENGIVDCESVYKNGLVNGMVTVYNPENGKVFTESKWIDDKEIWEKAYWKNGNLMQESYREEGGKVIEWYENGQKEFEGRYSYDIEEEDVYCDFDGEVTRWFEDGKVESICNYKKGKLHGKSTEWNKNGEVISVNHFSEAEQIPKDKYKGNVYIMKNTRNGYTKIGFTKNNPRFRERTLQSEEPEVELIGHWKGSMYDEDKLHKGFLKKRVRGEWFDLNKDDINQIEEYFNG